MKEEKKIASWIRLPLQLLREQGLSKASATVCAVLIDRCTSPAAQSAGGWIQIRITSLARLAGCDPRTVRRALVQLSDLGLISIDSGKSSGEASRYKLTGCVELCGTACQPKHAPASASGAVRSSRRQQQQQPTPEKLEKMQKYMTLVNRFKEEV